MTTGLTEVLDSKQLGALLKNQRKQMGVTQRQAADLCNVGPRFIGELEKGKPTVELAKALQVLQGYGLRLTVGPRGMRQ